MPAEKPEHLDVTWKKHWAEHPQLPLWHAETLLRRVSKVESIVPSSTGKKTQVTFSTNDPAKAETMLLFTQMTQHGIVEWFGYDSKRGSASAQFADEESAQRVATLFEALSPTQSEGIVLKPATLQLKGSTVGQLGAERLNLLMDILSVFGRVTLRAVDPTYHISVEFHDKNGAEIAAADATACLTALQPYFAKMWSLVLTRDCSK